MHSVATLLFALFFGLSTAQSISNSPYTWNLWLSGFENIPHMVISGRFPSVRQFITVYIDASLTEFEAQRRLEQWAVQQNPADQQKYRSLESLLNKTHQNLVTVVRDGFNRPGVLSPQAQNIIREIQRIENNKYLSIRDQQRQIAEIIDGITYNIQSELLQFDHNAVQLFVQRYGMPTVGDQPIFNLWNNANGAGSWTSGVNGGNAAGGPVSNGNSGSNQDEKSDWGAPGTTTDGEEKWGAVTGQDNSEWDKI
ncbi:hypothetical protein QR680_007785 [Steinernema hermaphroditum]|uniref:SXP/RAL-2 family protein Ani s 5-like cation-binding domain-containing protein n=1 Tax=Steinernema hermaphroditum TaxID=289476 RepID=A0AA39IGF4_9BILA|nr:hypothetical protein QR680_007785 [Steinernema hermaphroditum]